MEIVDLTQNSKSLVSVYKNDTDVEIHGVYASTEEGLYVRKEKYLEHVGDRKINNYSDLVLTDKRKLSDMLVVKGLSSTGEGLSFSSTLLNSRTGNYLTFSTLSTSDTKFNFTYKNQRFVDPNDKMFEITLLDSVSAEISHRTKERVSYYLTYDNGFKFSSTDNIKKNVFIYVLDKDNGYLSLYKTINSGEINVDKLVTLNGDSLDLSTDLLTFSADNFKVNYYIKDIKPKVNVSWVSYDPRHSNSYTVVADKSISDLENNYLFSSQYSYVTGDNIEVNILTLKNQKTHKNYTTRADYLDKRDVLYPTVDNRTYTGLFTGNDQERGDYGITLGYEFYNADFKFKKDSYTTFITPDSLYPYEKININDLGWHYKGSIGGENPYTADKVFQKKEQSNSDNTTYLCSWLYRQPNGENIWLDRYIFPEKTNFANSLSTAYVFSYSDPINATLHSKLLSSEYYDVPFVYNTLEEEYGVTPQTDLTAMYGHSYFDKRSDLVILPSSEYIYHRLGNDYIDKILETIADDLIENGLVLKTSTDGIIQNLVDTYVLDGNSYAMLDNYDKANTNHGSTIMFWLQSDDWSQQFGHQLFGNLNNKGIALYDDRKITPFITIQDGSYVYTYNTAFELVDKASLESEENNVKIHEIIRTDHLNTFTTITYISA